MIDKTQCVQRLQRGSSIAGVLNHGLLYTWTEDSGGFFQILYDCSGFTIICRFLKDTKFEGLSSKIEPALPISIWNFK